MTTISVIVGSTREGRFGDKPGQWIHDHIAKRAGVSAKVLDLRDFPMPFFDQMMTPAMEGRPSLYGRGRAALDVGDRAIRRVRRHRRRV